MREFTGYVAYCAEHDKHLYDSRKQARKAARRAHPGQRLSPYPCAHHPGLWHLGHMPPVVARGRAERPS